MLKTYILMTLFLLSFQGVYADELPQLGKDSTDKVVKTMTLDEKIRLLTGTGEVSEDIRVAIGETDKIVPGAAGTTYPIPRLGIPAIVMADGPAGLRIRPYRDSSSQTYFCTAFPVATLLASTWNTQLIKQVGYAMGNEALEYGCDVLLAPAINIHRNPICGRNFEYYSEDPLLTGKIASAMIQGIQQNGVGTSIKHFAANNQETNRIANNSIVSTRALREIYLKGFEIAVKEAYPWTVMSSYNKINGTYTSESKDLLTTILRDEWKYGGMVVTDWFGGRNAAAQVWAGNDLIMPGKIIQQKNIQTALQKGNLFTEDIDRNVKRILELILKTPRFRSYQYSDKPDLKTHAKVARASAAEGMVLLKNENQTLPLAAEAKNIAVFGNTSYNFITGGTGSGDVAEEYSVSPEEGLSSAGFNLDKELKNRYLSYMDSEVKKIDMKKYNHITPPRIEEFILSEESITEKAKASDIAIITIGRNSGEYTDRKIEKDFNLSRDEQYLIETVSKAFHKDGKKVIIILNIGGVIETTSWKNKADAILLAWQAGQEGGNAVADILCGKINPSGKLTMTFPQHYEDGASSKNFPVIGDEDAAKIYREFYTGPTDTTRKDIDYTCYEEDIFVGYRYFDKYNVNVSFPFGYGLSYTDFKYSALKMNKEGGNYKISCTITNTGKYPGKEVVQIYVKAPGKTMPKPEKELKAFSKTRLLLPGEKETLSFIIPQNELTSFNDNKQIWEIEAGKYYFEVAASSRDIKQSLTFRIPSSIEVEKVHPVLLPKETLDKLK